MARGAYPKGYLKYWRVIRYFFKRKYGLNQEDLDMMLFLYDEKYFGYQDFRRFEALLGWDKRRFRRLKEEGWIESFRKWDGKNKTLFTMTLKGRRAISQLYKKLNGEEIPIDPTNNEMFKRNVSFSDKVYRNMIMYMRAEVGKFKEQRQRHAPE
ncbi:MAG: transcriptional regulator [Podoviridae sp. ctrTa16]|nr:MAG: transcriptional regulator [Podoviridae sp. ctrTa16]